MRFFQTQNSQVMMEFAYSPEKRELYVRFMKSPDFIYVYSYVPPNIVSGLIGAPSTGSYFAKYIRNTCPFTKHNYQEWLAARIKYEQELEE